MGKQMDERVRSADYVASAAETHAKSISDQFKTRFREHITADDHVHIDAFFRVLARALRANAASLQKTADAYELEITDDDAPRARRDEALTSLVGELTSFRNAVTTTYGTATAQRLGFSGRTPEDADGALSLARHIQHTVESRDFHWPRPTRHGMRIDPDAWLTPINSYATALAAALKDVVREKREADAALSAREKSRTRHDDDFGPIANTVSAVMTLVGETELAARVRPSTRRPGTAEATEEPAQPAPQPAPVA